MSSFPLPRAPQHMYSKWFKRVLSSGTFARYTILWVGSQLECRFKSDNLAENIGPHHVFVLKKGSSYGYAVIDNSDQVYRLPKKYFTACFPGVQYSSIPEDNMITLQITKKDKIKIPFIPPSFHQQKQLKTTRHKRKRTTYVDDISPDIEKIDFDVTQPTWSVLENRQVRDNPTKRQIMVLLRSLLEHVDRHGGLTLSDPFDGTDVDSIRGDDDKMRTLKTILGFVYYYCRAELGCHVTPKLDNTALQAWVGNLS